MLLVFVVCRMFLLNPLLLWIGLFNWFSWWSLAGCFAFDRIGFVAWIGSITFLTLFGVSLLIVDLLGLVSLVIGCVCISLLFTFVFRLVLFACCVCLNCGLDCCSYMLYSLLCCLCGVELIWV